MDIGNNIHNKGELTEGTAYIYIYGNIYINRVDANRITLHKTSINHVPEDTCSH